MSKRIVINPIFTHLQGKYNLADEDGCKTGITISENKYGTKSLFIGDRAERNYETNPLTEKEKAHQSKFKQASAKTKLTMKDESQLATFQAEFTEAKKAGTTDCKSLRGYVFSQYYKNAEYVPSAPSTGGGGGGSDYEG